MIYFVWSRKRRTEKAPPERNHMIVGMCFNQRDAVEHLKELRRRSDDTRAFGIAAVKNEDIAVPIGVVKE